MEKFTYRQLLPIDKNHFGLVYIFTLQNETVEKCVPCIDNIQDGLKVYYKYYTEKDELAYGIKAFTFCNTK